MKNKKMLDLQRFAMTVQTTTTTGVGNDLSPEMKTFYDKQLLEEAQPQLVHDQFGQVRNIPRGNGKTIEFRKFSSLPKALTPLTEGVTPDGNKLNVTAITATVQQYGDYVPVSDMLDMTAIDPILAETTQLLGNQAGVTLDTISREELQGGTNVYYVPDRTDPESEQEVTARGSLTAGCNVTLYDFLVAAAILKNANTARINGSYVAIVHPYTALAIIAEAGEGWRDVMKYAKPENLLSGEIGTVGGIRFCESSEAKIYEGEGSEGLSVFGSLVLGANAYGKTAIEGGALETIVHARGSSGVADPLNQRGTVGWKATKATKRLCEEYMVRVEHTCGGPFAKAKAN